MRIISIFHGLCQINVAKFLLQPRVELLVSTLQISSTLILHHILWNRDESRWFIVLNLLFLLKIVLFRLVWGLMLLSYGDKLIWSLIISDFIFAGVAAQPAQPSDDLRAWASCCCRCRCHCSVVLIVGSRWWHRDQVAATEIFIERQSDCIELVALCFTSTTATTMFNTLLSSQVIFNLIWWNQSDLWTPHIIINVAMAIFKNVLFLFHQLFELVLHQLALWLAQFGQRLLLAANRLRLRVDLDRLLRREDGLGGRFER